MKDLVLRCLACNAGIVSSYPLETLKVSQQTNKDVKMMAGIQAPIIFSSFTNGLRFHIYSLFKRYSVIFAIILAGSVSGILEFPYQSTKLKLQVNTTLVPGGQSIIFFKELIGTFIHFSIFNFLTSQNSSDLQISLYGALSAVIGMTIVYPYDTIFVNYKINNIQPIQTLKQKKIWKGYIFNLLRTFVGYSVTMFLQSKIW
tara:strand:+ start:2286 stop:2888 length:603 start_codon:yes stop_codon:yes gene_type:complete